MYKVFTFAQVFLERMELKISLDNGVATTKIVLKYYRCVLTFLQFTRGYVDSVNMIYDIYTISSTHIPSHSRYTKGESTVKYQFKPVS